MRYSIVQYIFIQQKVRTVYYLGMYSMVILSSIELGYLLFINEYISLYIILMEVPR